MIRLGKIPTEPFWLDLLGGLRVQVRPLDTRLGAACDAEITKRIGASREAFDAAKQTGAPWSGIDWNDENARAGELRYMRACVYAEFGIVAWEGVYPVEGDEPAPVSPATIAELMRLNAFAQNFLTNYLGALEMKAMEGNVSGLAPNGTPAGAQTTAAAAGSGDSPAPTADEAQAASAAAT